MTVRVTTLKGPDAGLYYVEALPRYYLDAGEPPGRWLGDGLDGVGVAGSVQADAFVAAMEGRHPGTGDRLGRAYGTESVRGYDVTCSAPKSVSVLWALGDEALRSAVLAAHDAAVAEVVRFIESEAHTRISVAGDVVVVDAQGIAAALFRQHTSRTRDPQLHTHAVVIAKVRAPNGAWRALDGRMVKVDQRTLSAIFHAGLRAELTRRIGAEWRQPENGIAEIRGVPEEVLAVFSTRTQQVERRITTKLARFRETMGREPTPRERWRVEREAVRGSRPRKPIPKAARELHAEWRQVAGDLGIDPDRLVTHTLGRRVDARALNMADEEAMAAVALGVLAESRSTWRRNDLIRELARAVPATVTDPAADVRRFVERLAERVIDERCVELAPPAPLLMPRRRDGRPVTESTLDRRLTLPAILAEEERLVTWATGRWTAGGEPTWRLTAPGLDGPQRAAARAAAGTEPLVLLVGPAGAGKTTALRAAVAQLRAEGRSVFGVAPSATAASILAAEAGVAADTIDKLLVEYDRPGGPGADYRLSWGGTVIVDEASMVGTAKLARLARLADRQRWRVVLVGDPYQLSAVERGGVFAHLIDIGPGVELERVHRFSAEWEREASLGLRRGDPDALGAYESHGRLHDGSVEAMETAVLASWAETRSGGERVAMVATTNETVARLNQLAQTHRRANGELSAPFVVAGASRVHVGDEITTRANDRRLRTDRGVMVKNRAQWRVRALGRDGAVTAVGRDGRIVLPAAYVATSVDLGYAETVHASQGRTVDRSLLLLDGPIDGRAIYVALTRGRHGNDAYVVTTGERSARDVLTQAMARDWVDHPAVAVRAELTQRLGRLDRHPAVGRAKLATQSTAWILGPDQLRALLAEQHRLDSLHFDHRQGEVRNLRAQDTADRHLLGDLHVRHCRLDDDNAGGLAGERSLNPLRRRERIEHRQARTARQLQMQHLATRIQDASRRIAERAALIQIHQEWLAQHRHEIERYRQVRAALQRDVNGRGRVAGQNPPPHLTSIIGRPPASDDRMWETWCWAAGRVEQLRVAVGFTNVHAGMSATSVTHETPWVAAAMRTLHEEIGRRRLTQRLWQASAVRGRGHELGR